MSFSFARASSDAATIKTAIAQDVGVPQCLKDYVGAGVDALVKRYGDDLLISVTVYGHLHNSDPGNIEETSATISVKPTPR